MTRLEIRRKIASTAIDAIGRHWRLSQSGLGGGEHRVELGAERIVLAERVGLRARGNERSGDVGWQAAVERPSGSVAGDHRDETPPRPEDATETGQQPPERPRC